ncbi:uroporphyrinogen decarboxylase family protein [Fimbriimonas ginsengisoli]|uniref:Uroporphyrinogen decarboxylase (URO-D) n=1 Tax=Fimbriimonas ginsengisoli Gsoil 348 TaxID=661478 RepID=A0A068NKK2_FIMGI|nr:uroporphyrinogen decarboxylase family protein [Fimbriimonas ginsengisoli]AIE84073.1 uroporphyrinogen decarboxylase (URO-D) [Fimbriimonas ginsengisoli Gsoil 348]
MNTRERLFAAARRGEPDRQPLIYWPGMTDSRSDVVVLAPDPEFVAAHSAKDERPKLIEVPNPFGRAWARGIDLNAELAKDPKEGARILDEFAEAIRTMMSRCLDAGADGVLYRLHGATSVHCTPMQYGGHYLERDRELLESVKGATLNLLFVVGDADLYLDFVSDLPAHFFGWDDRTSGIGTEQGRAMRDGAVATFDESADLRIVHPLSSATKVLEKPRT